jgi:hypothetical protein
MKIGERLLVSSKCFTLFSRESTGCLTFFIWLCGNSQLPRWSNNVVVINDDVDAWLNGEGVDMFGDYMKHIARLCKADAINVIDWDKGIIMINPSVHFNGSPKERVLVLEKWDRLKDRDK